MISLFCATGNGSWHLERPFAATEMVRETLVQSSLLLLRNAVESGGKPLPVSAASSWHPSTLGRLRAQVSAEAAPQAEPGIWFQAAEITHGHKCLAKGHPPRGPRSDAVLHPLIHRGPLPYLWALAPVATKCWRAVAIEMK